MHLKRLSPLLTSHTVYYIPYLQRSNIESMLSHALFVSLNQTLTIHFSFLNYTIKTQRRNGKLYGLSPGVM
jgi:hypothetical protein